MKRVAIVPIHRRGDSADQAPLMFRVLMSTVMRSIFTDKNNQEQLFLGPAGPGRDLEFCVVRPGGLGFGPPTASSSVIDGEAGSIAAPTSRTFASARSSRKRSRTSEGAVHQQRGRDVLDQGPRR